MASLFPKQPEEPDGHPTQEHRDVHGDDYELRECGFKIKHRPVSGSAIWERGGKEFTQAAAIRTMLREIAHS